MVWRPRQTAFSQYPVHPESLLQVGEGEPLAVDEVEKA